MIDQMQFNHKHTVMIDHSKTRLWLGMLLILVVLGVGLATILYGILFETT